MIALLLAAAGAYALTRGGDSTTKAAAVDSSSSAESTPTTLAQRTDAQREADRVAAQGFVLHAEDMPGWTPVPVTGGPTNSPAQFGADADFAACTGVTRPDPGPDGPVAVSGDKFDDGAGRQIGAEANVYVNPRAAKVDFDQLDNKKVMPCLAQFIDRWIGNLTGAFAPGVKLGSAVVTDWHIGNVHDEYVGIRANIGIQAGQASGRVAIDMIFVLRGRTQITLGFLTNAQAITVDDELRLTNLVVDRVPES